MKKISIVGVLVESANWVLHPLANYKELQEYRMNYDKEILGFHKHVEKMKNKIEKKEQDLCKISAKYDGIRTKLSELEIEKYDLKNENRDMKTSIRSFENKLVYRNRVIDTLRKEKQEFKCQIQELEKMLDEARNEVVILAKKVEFCEKQAKKTPKEKVDYLMKRGKK